MAHHDLGYKYLFAHPELARELLADFTDFGWLGAIDASAWERVNPGYVSERFSERRDDIVWRVHAGDQWFYIYILLEFQSGVDHWMALRMQVYIGLLYQDLVKREELGPASMLPLVLPLVFYNGAAEWRAAKELSALVMKEPDILAPFQAAQRYFLIDQRRLDASALAQKCSVLSLLFRLELSQAPEVLAEVLSALAAWLAQDAQAPLRRSVSAWVEQHASRQFRHASLLDALCTEGGGNMDFVQKYETWADMFEDRGLQKGLVQGREEGREEGLQEARASVKRALVTVLERRFGKLHANALLTLEHSSLNQLERWLESSLDTPSAEALLTMADGKE